MDLSAHETEAPASEESLADLAAYVGRPLPARYAELLRASNGLFARDFVVLYAAEDVPERSETYAVQQQAPGFLLIGGDSGGRAFTLELGPDDPPVSVVEHGSMHPDDMEPVAETLSSWIAAGFALPDDDEDDAGELDLDDLVDVYLETLPHDGLPGLARVRKLLRLEVGLLKLKELSECLPALLVSGVAYGSCLGGCSEVNAEDDCIRVRPHGSPRDGPGLR